MACFLVPMGEAIVTTIIQKTAAKREKKSNQRKTAKTGLSWSRKLSWLNQLLWGGTILLALEHAWHGEVTLWPPFLTAMKNPSEIVPMFREMATIGVGMAVFVTFIWIVMIYVAERKFKGIPKFEVDSVGGGTK